jgi:hypothetical protein
VAQSGALTTTGIGTTFGAAGAAVTTATDPTSAATAAALAPPIMAGGQNNLANLAGINIQTGMPSNIPANIPPEMVASYLAGQQGGVPGSAGQLRSLIPPGALKLYLTGMKASKSEVELLVSLRNDSQIPLKIPGGIKAVVRSSGQPDKQGKVNFSAKVVNSGATVTGNIKVPGKSLDPTADVVIPISALTRGAIADIHLSVPISAR